MAQVNALLHPKLHPGNTMSKLITEAAIRSALRDVAAGKKGSAVLSDAAPRGAGRLLLIVQPGRAEWYARRISGGQQKKTKLGAYPDMTLAEARQRFEAAPEADSKPRGGATIAELFEAYLQSLRDDGKPSVAQAEKLLTAAAEKIGTTKLAADVTPEDVVAVLKPVYLRGARVQADKYRMYIGRSFRWAMRATHDYRAAVPRDWGLRRNPVDAIARDTGADGVGNRWLSEAEYRQLLADLDGPGRRRTRVREAVALLMLTGQRVREILQLRASQWDSAQRLLTWETTKNGKPHVLPVCARAAAILDGLTPSKEGWLFPGEKEGCYQPDGAVLVWLKRYAAGKRLAPFSGRDLRRTWKTLAGQAGLTKVERDLLQNHTEADVSSRHYDRYEYLTEKRAAVLKWEAWLQQ